jgi:hypothetical protein
MEFAHLDAHAYGEASAGVCFGCGVYIAPSESLCETCSPRYGNGGRFAVLERGPFTAVCKDQPREEERAL